MQNQDYYNKHIKHLEHIVGGSTAVKKQLPNFRDSNDLDIMINGKIVVDYLSFNPAEIDEYKKSDYDDSIYSIIFNDGSKIDLMINYFGASINIDNIDYLKITEIVMYKKELICKFIDNKSLEQDNKHLNDLIFIFKNFKFDNIIETQQNDDLPF